MPARLHPLAQHAHDLDKAGIEHAVENHMHRIADRRLAAFGSAVPDGKAANACDQFAAVNGRKTVGWPRPASAPPSAARDSGYGALAPCVVSLVRSNERISAFAGSESR